ncbi:phosphoglycerate dehydrogenase [Lentilactobacillus sp. SPB1-3]|uniref:Phosphoglycerate dehydrogenase n=1 Tax=Lentilactobacillus terminaliae TaxID=3003483 RepID=A0ACD5DDU6_9LACO|nr:phosphoglycerate dehydrogenase [Lentilactobacillus sp. SPB1-3]MCZ0977791.1 phosphoglycerate dehydrogenase [Lentilactobacillus sp. SPB1-3]
MENNNVVVPKGMLEAGNKYLIDHGFNPIVVDNDAEAILKQAKDAVGAILFTEPFTAKTIDQMPNLKVIARHGVGYDAVDYDYAASKGIWVTITPNANASTVAETTLADMFDLSKNITKYAGIMKQGESARPLGFDLAGKTLGIMGFGRIGQLVAEKVSGLGMNVLINSRTPKDTKLGKFVDRETILREADILSLHMPVTEETRHSIGMNEFKKMKKTASLINLGRGALINQDELIEALKNGEIAQAALDVTEPEPLPRDSELYNLDNVLLTPHIAANTVESMTRMAVDAASEVVRVLNNEQPQWPVNHID